MSKGPQDSSMEQLRQQRREEQTSYQIFPEPSEQMKVAARLKERLPSIVVEPSEESGEQNSVLDEEEEEEEEDPFQDRCDPAGSGQEEQVDVDRVPRFKRASLPCIQIDYSRLTPPPSPTLSRAAPPCFHS